MHFPSRNFHFGRPKTDFSGFEKWEAKGEGGSSPHFVIFPPSIFNFPPSLLQFFFFSFQFSPPFFFFPCLFFPSRSAEISQSEVWGGHSAPLPVTPLTTAVFSKLFNSILSIVKTCYYLPGVTVIISRQLPITTLLPTARLCTTARRNLIAYPIAL